MRVRLYRKQIFMTKRYTFANLIVALFFTLSANAQWIRLTSGISDEIRVTDIAVKDSSVFGVGYRFSDFQSYVLRSFNNGVAWDSVLPLSPGFLFETIAFKDKDTAFIGGFGSKTFIVNTVDGGHHWNYYQGDTATAGIIDMKFLDGNKGFAAGYGASQFSSGNCYYTNDGGHNWIAQTTDTGTCLDTLGLDYADFVDVQTAYAVNNFLLGKYLLKTTDTGKHWSVVYEQDGIGGVYFWNVNNGIMVAAGGKIFKTTDGGMHWTPKTSPTTAPLFSVSFIDNNNGFAVGGFGKIVKTMDGGETWTNVTSPTTQSLFRVKCFDGKCYASGDGGVILRSTPATTAVNKLPLNYQLNVYPNPGSSILNISSTVNQPFKSISVNLVNMKGQVVCTGHTNQSLLKLDINNLAPGIYTAIITADDQQLAEQVIIQH